MIHRSSQAAHGSIISPVGGTGPLGRGRGRRVPVMSSRLLLFGACLMGVVQSAHAQRAVAELRLGLSSISYRPRYDGVLVFADHVNLSGNVRLWSRGPVSLAGEVSANVRLPARRFLETGCPDVLGRTCVVDDRELGDVYRVGVTSRIGKRDGSGAYALATAGWWGTLQYGDVNVDGRLAERWRGDRVGGVALELGAGTSLPVGDRRTGIEARGGWLRGVRQGRMVQLGLTRRW